MNYLGAVTAGYTVEQILNYLSRNFPDLGPRIKQAFSSGKSPEDIIKYISKFDKKQLSTLKSNKKPFEPFPESGTTNRYIQSQQVQKELNPIPESVQKGVLGAAGLAAGSLAAPVVAGALQRALPKNILQPQLLNQQLQGIESPLQTTASLDKNNALNDKIPSQSPVNPTNISPQQTLPQPELNIIDSKEVLKRANFTSKIDPMIDSGNDAETISAFYRKFNPQAVTQIEKQARKPFEQVVSDYIQTRNSDNGDDKLGFKAAFKTMEGGASTEKLYQGIFDALKNGKDTFAGIKDPLIAKAKPYFDKGLIKSPEDLKKFANGTLEDIEPPESGGQESPKPKYPPPPKGGGLLSRKSIEETFSKANPPSKGYIVETPQGVGEIKEIRNGQALVEVDGKMLKMLEEELMQPGIPQQDLASLHDELIEGIKRETGKEVSRHVEWAGYDPEHRELIYKPWGDKEYTYDDIDPEDVEMLTNLLTQRKTTGENYIGSWEAGTESPIGAAMHALITKIRNKAKEAGKEKAHKRRYESVYSAYEPAQKASKQKKEAEKKRLKDEEKRRKAKEKQSLQHSSSLSSVS